MKGKAPKPRSGWENIPGIFCGKLRFTQAEMDLLQFSSEEAEAMVGDGGEALTQQQLQF